MKISEMPALTLTCPGKRIKGELKLERSKSICNRVQIIRALCASKFAIHEMSGSEDSVFLEKVLDSGEDEVFAGEGGTSYRFATAYLATLDGREVKLRCSEGLQKRPIGLLVNALRKLGAEIEYLGKEDYPELFIRGKKLRGGTLQMDGSVSSQFITALLLIAPCLDDGLRLQLIGQTVSLPFIRMTLKLMDYFGVPHKWENNTILIPNQAYKARDIKIEADWTGASYFYEIAALAEEAEMFLPGLKENSIQGDARIAKDFEILGVRTSYEKRGVHIKVKKHLKPERFTGSYLHEPDIVQSLAVTHAVLGIEAEYRDVQNLMIKETDRISALKAELKKIGSRLEYRVPDVLLHPADPGSLAGLRAEIATWQDHRMAMAFAPLALCCKQVKINNPDVVKKSFPGYWEELKKLGFEGTV